MGVPITGSSNGIVSARPTRSERSRTSRQLIIWVNFPHITHHIRRDRPIIQRESGASFSAKLIEQFDAPGRGKTSEAGIQIKEFLVRVVALACTNQCFSFVETDVQNLVDSFPAIGEALVSRMCRRREKCTC